MKILVVSNLFPNREEPHRGIFVYHQVKEIIKQGHEVRVVVPVPWAHPLVKNRSEKWKRFSRIPMGEVFDGIPVYYSRYFVPPRNWGFAYYGWLYYLGMRKQIHRWKKEGFDFDIVHGHVALPGGYAGMLVAQKYGKPLIVTVHGQDVTTSIYRGNRIRRAVVKVLAGADKVVTVSSMLKKKLTEVLSWEEKVRVVYNGVPRCLLESRASLPEPRQNKVLTLLSVGNLYLSKGHGLLIKAFERIYRENSNIRLQIVGDGEEREHLARMIQEMDMDGHITLEGRKRPDEVMTYMENCDIFVLPSWKEGFGIVYLEAMAHGKPVIGCQGQGIGDVIIHGVNGFLVPPKDEDALVDVLTSLIKDEGMRKRVGEAGKKLVEASFTWDRNGDEMMDIYREVLEKGNG